MQRIVIFFFLALVCLQIYLIQAVKIRTYDKRPEYADPDSYGYRYCAFWKLADGSVIFPTCDPYKQDRCGEPIEFEYKCCPGYRMTEEFGEKKCALIQNPWTPAVDMLEELDASKAFVNKLSSQLSGDEPKTIFVPETAGSVGFENKFQNSDLVKLHIAKGRIQTDEMQDNMLIETTLSGEKLRVTKYPFGVVCVECMEIVEGNLESKDGIIHMVRFPLGGRLEMPDNGRKLTLMELMRQSSKTKAFSTDLPEEVKQKLSNYKEGDQLYTVMVPGNWNDIRNRLGNNKTRLAQVAASHVYDDMLCSAGLVKNVNRLRRAAISKDQTNRVDSSSFKGSSSDSMCSVANDNDSELNTPGGQRPSELNKDRYGGRRMAFEQRIISGDCGQKARITHPDMTAKNGVLHIIDVGIIPIEGMTFDEVLKNKACVEELQISEFVNLLKECELYKEAQNNYAVLTPQDASFVWWSNYQQFHPEYVRFKKDKEYRCRIARYHIMRNDGPLDDIPEFNGHTQGFRSNNKNNYLYETAYIRKSDFSSELNFHYSPVNDMRVRKLADGTSIYVTHRINVIPERNITDILNEESEMSKMNQMTQQVDMKSKYFDKNAPKNLYLVVSDNGWNDSRWAGTTETVKKLQADMKQNFLSMHHVPLYLWGGDIGYFRNDSETDFPSSAGLRLTFWMDDKGTMRIGHEGMPRNTWPKVVRWNIPARDGIVWVLEGPLGCTEDICEEAVDIDNYLASATACNSDTIRDENGTVISNLISAKLHNYAQYNQDVCHTAEIFNKQTTREASIDQNYKDE